MKWTNVVPTTAGWYWNKNGSFERGGPLVAINLYEDDMDDRGLGSFSPRHDEFVRAESLGGLWSDAPIPLPE